MDNYKISSASAKYLHLLKCNKTTENNKSRKHSMNETFVIDSGFVNSSASKFKACDEPFRKNNIFKIPETPKLSSGYFSFGRDIDQSTPDFSLSSFNTGNADEESCSILASPPFKKLKLYESRDDSDSMMFFHDTSSRNMNTESLFNSSITESGVFPGNRKRQMKLNFSSESKLLNPSKYEISYGNSSVDPSEMNFEDFSMTKNEISSDLMQSECRDFEKSILNEEKLRVKAFYQTSYIEKTTEKLIRKYYKEHKFSKPTDAVFNEDNLMEPNLDYVCVRLGRNRNISLGKKDLEVFVDKAFECDGITESLEEIEKSFENTTLITSTPEQLPDNNCFVNVIDNIELEISKHVEMQNKLVDDTNRWSEITHVSCSVPIEVEQGQDFDLRSVFIFNDIQSKEDSQKSNLLLVDEESMNYDQDKHYDNLLSFIQDQDLIDEDFLPKSLDKSIIQSRKAGIMTQIENIIYTMLESLANQKSMILKVRKIKDWKQCEMSNHVLTQKETEITVKNISFTNKNTERTFTVITHILCEIYKMLTTNVSCTKRELYYRDVELMRSQSTVDRAIDEICKLLNVMPWELGVLSSSKGLIAGNLEITFNDNETINYSSVQSVPQNPSEISCVHSDAKYVLVVEKDTVFTRMINEKIFENIGSNIILVTAKGYPDFNTRLVLKRLLTDLKIPIYILVDADPHGVEIMCTYKYGSLQKVHNAEHIAVSCEWIGIHPSDIEVLDIPHSDMTTADLKKVDELLKRPYVNDHLRRELDYFKTHKIKAEIENIYTFSMNYLVNDYIPRKIREANDLWN